MLLLPCLLRLVPKSIHLMKRDLTELRLKNKKPGTATPTPVSSVWHDNRHHGGRRFVSFGGILPGGLWQSAHTWPRKGPWCAPKAMHFLGYGFCTMSFFALFLFLCTAWSQATSWLIDKGGKEDVAIRPPVPSPELSELMMNLSERRFWNLSHQGPPLLLALAKVVWKENETLGMLWIGYNRKNTVWENVRLLMSHGLTQVLMIKKVADG